MEVNGVIKENGRFQSNSRNENCEGDRPQIAERGRSAPWALHWPGEAGRVSGGNKKDKGMRPSGNSPFPCSWEGVHAG